MKKIPLNFIVGMFFLGAFIILFYFTIVTNPSSLFSKNKDVIVKFNSVSQLSTGHAVIFRGLKIGKVSELLIQPDHVQATFSLRENIVFFRDYKITIKAASLLGGKYVEIINGTQGNGLASYPLEGSPDVNIGDVASKALSSIRDIFQKLKAPIEFLKNLLGSVSEGKGTIGKLFTDDSFFSNLKFFSEKLKQISETLDIKKINKIVRNIESLSDSLNDTKGTIGKIIKSPDIYNEFKKVISRAREILEDIQEQTPVQTVGNIIFGAL